MATAYEAAYHIGQTRLRGGLPSTDARFSDAKLLKLLSDELQGNIAPLVHNAKAEHGVVQYTVAVAAGQSACALPENAFASTLRDVYWVDASGNITPLEPLSAADPRVYAFSRNNGTPRYYYLRGSRVNVVPPPSAAGTLALPHYARPNHLALAGSAAGGVIITATQVNPIISCEVEFATADDANAFVAAVANLGGSGTATVDVISGEPGFESIAVSSTPFSGGINQPNTCFVAVPIADFAGGVLPAVGDYIMQTGYSPVPQCPVELFPLLHARAALVAVPSTGDMSQASAALAAQVADLEAKARAFLQPRVESGSPPPGKGLGNNPLLGVVSGTWSGY